MSKMKFTFAKKYIRPIVSIIVLVVLAISIFIIVRNKDAIFGKVVDKTTLYTQEELDKKCDSAYNEGYNNAHKDNAELKQQLSQCEETIANKERTIAERQATIDKNNEIIEQNKVTIASLQEQLEDNTEEINRLTSMNTQLQNDNATNLLIITELNEDIERLENQVSLLSAQIEANEKLVAEYEANKNAWQSSIAYYESFIEALETDTQAVALFEVNSSISKALIVEKGASVSNVDRPEDTDNLSFVGWYVNDVLVEDIGNYPITTNTIFVAKFEVKLSVNFITGDEAFTTLKVAKNSYVQELETLPTKEGYIFEGFTLNGVDVIDYTTYQITENTNFIARFTKLHTVTFFDNENNVLDTQQVKNGENITDSEALNLVKEGYDFDGYMVNENIVDYRTYPITANITFVAKFTKLYTVTFVTDNQESVIQKVRSGNCATGLETLPVKEGYEFEGFTLNGKDVVDYTTYQITEDTTFIASFTISPYGNWNVKFALNMSSTEVGTFEVNLSYLQDKVVKNSSSSGTTCTLTKINNGFSILFDLSSKGAYVVKGNFIFDKTSGNWRFVDTGTACSGPNMNISYKSITRVG